MYPEIPGVGGVTVGSPLFPRVTLHLAGDGIIQIDRPGMFDDKTDWAEHAGGATIDFSLSDVPDAACGNDPDSAPIHAEALNETRPRIA